MKGMNMCTNCEQIKKKYFGGKGCGTPIRLYLIQYFLL